MRISGFENTICINQFEYQGKVNEHETCRFTCTIKEKDIESFLNMVDCDCVFEDEVFSFNGHIMDVTCLKEISGTQIEVYVVGKTCGYDIEPHNRIFQNADKTLSDILSKLDSMSDVKHETKQDRAIEGILYQDNVSDWEFVVNVATLMGEYVFPGDKTFVGCYGVNSIDLLEDECIYYRYSAGVNGVSLLCKVNQNFSLGDVINYNGKKLFVHSKRYFLEGEQYYFEYCLFEIKQEKKDYEINNDHILAAIVKENKDPNNMGRVQVSFESDKVQDCSDDKWVWLPRKCFYATKDCGAVFIPQKGDYVIVKIQNGAGLVLGSIRTEKYSDVAKNVESKYLIFDSNIYAEYSNGNFSFVNNDNKICMTGQDIQLNIGDKVQIVINADKVCIQKDKTMIEITDDLRTTTANCVVESKGDISLDAANVNIKGKSGVSIN